MRGLLAIEPLYHQIVAGKKTQTRRSGGLDIINEQPDEWTLFNGGQYLLSPEMAWENLKSFFDTGKHIYGQSILFLLFIGNGHGMCNPVEVKPRYKVGEVLYLKEPTIIMGGEPVYKFDLPTSDRARHFIKWQNKLFMPEASARAYVMITGIKCERLMDISDEDCIAEGLETIVTKPNDEIGYKIYGIKSDSYTLSPKESFISLYKFANKVKEIPNLWVWAYTFEYLPDYKITNFK